MVIGSAEVGNTAIPSVGPKNKGRAHEHTHEQANCTPKLCLYLGPGTHFESHGVKDIYRGARVTCQWEGCFEKCSRHNFVRHIREKHLGHARRSTACNSEEGLRQHTSCREEPGDAGSQNESAVSPGGGCLPVEWMWAERATTQFYPSYQGETSWTPKGISPPQFRQSWLKAQIRRLDPVVPAFLSLQILEPGDQ
ncbi:hypothetical protein EV401DRAFT_1886956 [Pisolithus croceorrhizus]|nr:hypothetical protein EV401DRAFT_1886956 [Pisolithus croceorrhizus]